MKKVLCTLVVLGILLCMFMSLGVSADAAEGPKDLAVVALANEELSGDQVGMIKESLSGKNVLVIDVNGLNGDGAGYSYAYSDIDQGIEPANYKFIWPGMSSVPTVEVSDGAGNTCSVVILPVGTSDSAEAIGAYKTEGTVVIAVAPESCYNVQAAVDSGVDRVLTSGAVDAAGGNLIKVGSDSVYPVSVITVTATGAVSAEAMPMPAAVDTGVGPVEPETASMAYTVSLLPGDQGQGEIVSSEPITAGGTYTLPSCEFSAPGYDFSGWLLSSDGQVHAADEEIQVVDADITATATWTAQVQQVNVYFEAGSAEGVEITGYVDSATMDAGSTYALPDNGFTAPGYTFQGWSVDGGTMQPGEQITVSDNMTITATWAPEAMAIPAGQYTVTFQKGNEGAEGEMAAETVTEAKYTLPECKFTLADNHFNGWKVEGVDGDQYVDPQPAGTVVDMTGKDGITLTANWAADETETVTVTVTYKSGDNGKDETHEESIILTEGKATHNLISAEVAAFTAPEGKEFAGWLVGSETKQPNDAVEVTGAMEITAQWKDKVAPPPSEPQSPALEGVTPAGDLTYIQGGTDMPSITYGAKVKAVAVNNVDLTRDTDYQLSPDGTVLTFMSGYMNKILTGTYPMVVTFEDDADGTTYKQDTRNLVVKPNSAAGETEPPAATATPAPSTKTLDWDRAYDLTVDFAEYNMGSPTKVEIKYSDTDWREVKAENYTVNGTKITFKTASMLPSNWPNQTYTYRVTFGNAPMTIAADGTATNTVQLKLRVGGNINPIAAPTATPVLANSTGGTSPVTGDTNNVTLYVVLLVVLVAALAAVVIIMMKRKKR